MPYGANKYKEVSDMSSDLKTSPKAEWLSNSDKELRLFAYTCAISGKEGRALSLKGKAEEKAGMASLREELEKTKLDV